ncbi:MULTISPECIES: integrating conjugative element protein [Pseudomonas]|jgi:integrating conjugative element protein (TIGR03765 family)|uniref:Integrating conjugative element protein n=1 Tax=Pseudomonas putida (strain ATCC 700007 / DSM 6899 / JCM 31910 / BCRC 17059 / LMG 24140 / F1) TaxID=351746 RepID=A5W4K1_PSEP1|nr:MULTISPECIES: integrating conjugative element protein [Pseudomonas]MDD1997104.1 integrating conjugative element protein [Pseudomonas putida]MDD2010224.1 integrating conjugative element protein [Pseudomonas putida]MDS9591779.1 integrating conjugative element protein [Pseudomonas sp. HTZ1]OUS82893.1 integrating conjugative element protein [Pseudomonas putida]OUS88341.1 integrating conjugative element protein [Pseudomonas putida]
MNRRCWVTLCICLWWTVGTPAPPSQRPDPRALTWALPVHSTRLSPGAVSPRALSLPGFTPLFLVGHDVASLEWLAQHAQRLQDLGASGLAVEVADAPALRRIQAAAPGVDIWPVSGDDIAERLELQHYPVLITPTGLEQ